VEEWYGKEAAATDPAGILAYSHGLIVMIVPDATDATGLPLPKIDRATKKLIDSLTDRLATFRCKSNQQ
jgi:hypothetical protein